MPTKSVTPAKLNALTNDLLNARINFETGSFSIRLTATVLTAATLSNASITEVTGTNYTAGGIPLTTTIEGTAPTQILRSSTAMQWTKGAGAVTDAAFAYIYESTSGRIVGIADIRDGANPLDTTNDDLIITFDNGTDILQLA